MKLRYRIRYAENKCTGYMGQKTRSKMFKIPNWRPFQSKAGERLPGRFTILELARIFLVKEGVEFYTINAISLRQIDDYVIENPYDNKAKNYMYNYKVEESYNPKFVAKGGGLR